MLEYLQALENVFVNLTQLYFIDQYLGRKRFIKAAGLGSIPPFSDGGGVEGEAQGEKKKGGK